MLLSHLLGFCLKGAPAICIGTSYAHMVELSWMVKTCNGKAEWHIRQPGTKAKY